MNVRSSLAKLTKFKEIIEAKHIAFKSLVCLDVSIRWNSTFKMLKAAKRFQKAFERLEDDDRDYLSYFNEFEKRKGPPNSEDWNNTRAFNKFLEIFYDVTLSFLASLYVTSNSIFNHISLVKSEFNNWTSIENYDTLSFLMASKIKINFDKY